MSENLVLLKLGGSLITDKDKPYTPRLDKLRELAEEIRTVKESNPELHLILGHGSGSFGHTAARMHGTRDGVRTPGQWLGFTEVRFQAAELNRHVMESLLRSGISAIPFPPSSMVVSRDRKVIHSDLSAMRKSLDAGLLPVVYGDVTFDERLGGTILSTEDFFSFLAVEIPTSRILLAGFEAGVWEDFPNRTKLIRDISARDYERHPSTIGGSVNTDVTGGMKTKVEEMLALIKRDEKLTVQIFSAEGKGSLTRALQGENMGTLLRA